METKEYNFIIMWCSEGLECIIPIDMNTIFLEKMENENACSDTEHNLNVEINMLMLRARFNTQRYYEIYKLNTVNIDEQHIRNMFDENPQAIVNLIREKGVMIYNDRRYAEKTLIC
jgi:hypothetical protein